jgi:hypothetical protein
MMGRFAVEPLNRAATRAIQTLLGGQPNTTAKVAFAWTIAAGVALGRASTPTWSSDGTLVERLRELLGPDVVRRVVVK